MRRMPKLETYLFFDGNCAEAMQFYADALGATVQMLPVKGSPAEAHMPPGSGDKILHARLDAGGAVLMASDWMSDKPWPGKNGFAVTLSAPDAAAGNALFDKLADGGKVTMPFGKTFFAEGFGELVDRFGTPWMVIAESSGGA
jgi:PhnB protein